jgi:transcriptional regulator with XRE-family HTH domain
MVEAKMNYGLAQDFRGRSVGLSDFGVRLKEALDYAGMTQTALARALSVNLPTVNRWLNRGVIPDGESLLKLPGVLQVDGHWLLTGDGDMVRTPLPAETQKLLDDVAQLLDKARGVSLTRPLIPRPRPPADGKS